MKFMFDQLKISNQNFESIFIEVKIPCPVSENQISKILHV